MCEHNMTKPPKKVPPPKKVGVPKKTLAPKKSSAPKNSVSTKKALHPKKALSPKPPPSPSPSPSSVTALLDSAIAAIILNILVFGPQTHTPASDERTRRLQLKRIEIRDSLIRLGHTVKFAEELVDPTIAGINGNAYLQELVIMREYDLIVTLVGSPGSNAEAAAIALKPYIAQKTALFLDEGHKDGLVGAACQLAAHIGAHYSTYSYPKDLDDCHLLGYVHDRVAKAQTVKYLL
jgi:hypothetical protein